MARAGCPGVITCQAQGTCHSGHPAIACFLPPGALARPALHLIESHARHTSTVTFCWPASANQRQLWGAADQSDASSPPPVPQETLAWWLSDSGQAEGLLSMM